MCGYLSFFTKDARCRRLRPLIVFLDPGEFAVICRRFCPAFPLAIVLGKLSPLCKTVGRGEQAGLLRRHPPPRQVPRRLRSVRHHQFQFSSLRRSIAVRGSDSVEGLRDEPRSTSLWLPRLADAALLGAEEPH